MPPKERACQHIRSMSALGGKADIAAGIIQCLLKPNKHPVLSDYPILISPKRLRNPNCLIETGPTEGLRFIWHPISTAPFDRDLELGVADSDGVRAIPFPCRRVLGGWIKTETETHVAVRPTHWREWSTDESAACSPRDFAHYRAA